MNLGTLYTFYQKGLSTSVHGVFSWTDFPDEYRDTASTAAKNGIYWCDVCSRRPRHTGVRVVGTLHPPTGAPRRFFGAPGALIINHDFRFAGDAFEECAQSLTRILGEDFARARAEPARPVNYSHAAPSRPSPHPRPPVFDVFLPFDLPVRIRAVLPS